MDANRTSPGYELKGTLARLCLPGADRDPDRPLAWTNSVCILFLLIGIFGARPARIVLQPVPPVEKIIPVLIESLPPPPAPAQTATGEPEQRQVLQAAPETPQVVIVTPDAPGIVFAVPTIGNLVAPSALAEAPPLKPLEPPAVLKVLPSMLNNTGSGGTRPQPPYPKIALEQAQQGSVTLLITADEAGSITSVEVGTSSGFPVLDHSAMDYVRRRWTVPTGTGHRLFRATITYRLQSN